MSRSPNPCQRGWVIEELGSLVSFSSGGTPSRRNPKYWGGTVPWLSAKDLGPFWLQDSKEGITEDGAAAGSRVVPPNTILLLVRGMTLLKDVPVGLVRRSVAFNQDIKALECGDALLPEFLALALIARRADLRKLVDRAGHGTGRLQTGLLARMPITFPESRHEQARIVRVLASWMDATQYLETVLDRKKLLKRALMQQLLSGKQRLPGFGSHWGRIQLGALLAPTSRPVPKPDQRYRALGLRSHGKGTFHRMVEDPASVMMDTLYEVVREDLIVNITFAWEGAIAIVGEDDEGALVSHRFPTFRIDRKVASPGYLRHVILTRRFVHELGLVSPGGAGRNRVLNQRDFLKIGVPLPPINEQYAIAEFLDTADREIELLERQLELFRKQKRGLMQKLLTGQIRVGEMNDA